MAKRHRYTCFVILLVFVVFREMYPSSNLSRKEVDSNVVSGVNEQRDSVFDGLSQNKVASKEIDVSLRDICFMRDTVLGCRLDKLCKKDITNCFLSLRDIITQHAPSKVRLAIGDLKFEEAGQVIDSFLSSHSTWTIIEEPYYHTPKKEIILQEPSVPNIQSTLFRKLDRMQYPIECPKMWVEAFVGSEEFPTIISSMSYGISVSLETAAAYVSLFPTGEEWELARHCERPTWTCFFLAFTNCTGTHSMVKSKSDRKKILAPTTVPEPFNSMLKNTGIPNTLLWWRIHLMSYLMRPNYGTRVELALLEEELEKKLKLDTPCLTMYLREYDSFEKNMEVAGELLEMIEGKTILLILENDGDVSKVPKEGDEKEEGVQFVVYPRNMVKKEVYWYMTMMKLAGQCGAFVGSFSSDLASFIYQSMCLSNDACPLVGSVDGSEWNVG